MGFDTRWQGAFWKGAARDSELDVVTTLFSEEEATHFQGQTYGVLGFRIRDGRPWRRTFTVAFFLFFLGTLPVLSNPIILADFKQEMASRRKDGEKKKPRRWRREKHWDLSSATYRLRSQKS